MKAQRKLQSILFVGVSVLVCMLGLTSEMMAKNPWTQKADMLAARSYFYSCVINDTIYAIGGSSDPADSITSSVEIYDHVFNTWKLRTHLPEARTGFAAGVVDGKIYIMGGMENQEIKSTVLMYDPVTDSVKTKAAMPTARFALAAAVVDGKIYTIGGITGNTENTSVVEMYDPATDTWAAKESMPTKNNNMAASEVDGKIYVIGGKMAEGPELGLQSLLMYDPDTDSWSQKNSMHVRRWAPSSSVMDGKIYVIGGEKGIEDGWPGLNSVEMYDPVTDTWTPKAPMPTPRRGHSSSVLDQKIYVMGGTAGYSEAAMRTVEEYHYTASVPLVYIPDYAFLDALLGHGLDMNADGAISYSEAEGVNALNVFGKNIQDLTGIEAFGDLDTLKCHHNDLTTIELSFNTQLVYLDLYANDIAFLDVSNNTALEKLFCPSNALKTLDVSNNTLLMSMNCSQNSIDSLNVSNNKNLIGLVCTDNDLTSLDISQNPDLKTLHCTGNKLEQLDLCNNNAINKLKLDYMPSLDTVWVWESFPTGVEVDSTGSPNVVFIKCITGGIKEYRHLTFSIFPNPVNDQLTVESNIPGIHIIEITSLNGQLLFSRKTEGSSHQINLSSFEKGLYFITIRSRDYTRTEKFIKL
jgi:N-acetylneuraminic acid mutarotase